MARGQYHQRPGNALGMRTQRLILFTLAAGMLLCSTVVSLNVLTSQSFDRSLPTLLTVRRASWSPLYESLHRSIQSMEARSLRSVANWAGGHKARQLALDVDIHSAYGVTDTLLESKQWAQPWHEFPPRPSLQHEPLHAAIGTPLQKRFHIITTLYNGLHRFRANVERLTGQASVQWDKVHFYVIDDASPEFPPSDVLDVLSTSALPRVNYFRNRRRMGPGYCKWFLVDYLQRIARKCDVVLVIDGDDHLVAQDALAHLNHLYVTQKVLATYGSCIGRYCDEQGPVDPSRPFTYRWRYSHPRSFAAFLLARLSRHDFQDNSGTWLVKGTDRGFMYKVLSAVGHDRVAFVDKVLYNYTESQISSYKVTPAQQRRRLIVELDHRPTTSLHVEAIHILMCIYSRPAQLERVLAMLNQQDVGNYTVNLWICNNNASAAEMLRAVIARMSRSVVTRLMTMPENIGGFARFALGAWLVSTTLYTDYFVTLDDDVVFHSPGVLWQLFSSRRPKSYTCWYGKQFLRNSTYWDNTIIRATDIFQKERLDVKSFHYCGTGFSVVDASVFESEVLLNIPSRYLFVEDLWLSAVAREQQYSLGRAVVDVSMLTSPQRELWNAAGMWELKNEFLHVLREQFHFPY